MRILITTQVVDHTDPYLGFFHEWLVALAPKFESIEVVCLKEGVHALPSNVHVHSLGKEKDVSRLTYVKHFFSLIISLRRSYDAVFVHMNPEYIVLGGLLWKIWGKRIYLWYNHPKQGVRLMLAMLLSATVFHTSPVAGSAGTKKSVRMPAGIDTSVFSPQPVTRDPYGIYLQGRVMPSKRVGVAIEAVTLLRERGVPATLTIVGPEDVAYANELRKRHADALKDGIVTFCGPKENKETPQLFSAHAVALNLASGGHYDKTVLEAMACETPVIITSRAFNGRVDDLWAGKETALHFVEALTAFFALTPDERDLLGKKGRRAVIENEGLSALIETLAKRLGAQTI